MENKLKVVELFSGIGAWSKALENLNVEHEVLLSVDFDEYPVTAYNAIHSSNFDPIDITKLNEKEVPNCDIICYSPPCQAFSAAGKQGGFEDKRGILFFDALRIIKEKKPKYALMENVKGLTTKKFENEFNSMLNELEEAGYRNYIPNKKTINALNLNFPQNRERVFVVSIRSDIEQEFKFPSKVELTEKLIDYLEFDADIPILHNIYGGFKESNARVFESYSPTLRTSAGGGHIPSVVLKKDVKAAIVDDTYKNREMRVYDQYSPSIRSGRKGFKVAYQLNDKWFVEKEDYIELIKQNRDKVLDDKNYIIRQMTTLEAFKLMGFDEEDYYKAKKAVNDKYHNGKDKSDTRLYKMAGNSIVVRMCEEVFKNLLTV